MTETLSRVVLALVVIGVVALVAWQGLRLYARRFLRKAMDHTPSFEVKVLDAPDGITRIRLRLGGTERAMRIVSLSAPEEGVRKLSLEPPPGFVEQEDREGGEIEWRPLEAIHALPGHPLELEFRWDPDGEEVVRVFGRAEAGAGIGGVGTAFAVLAGHRPRLEVRASNLRSAIFAKARELRVVPRDLPEWKELEELEARLSSSDETRNNSTE